MTRTAHLGLSLLLCGAFLDAGRASAQVDVLSETYGVDFKPYLQRVTHDVRENWYKLVPASAQAPVKKKGKVTVSFSILKDGTVSDLRYTAPSGDAALDRAAYGAVAACNPFPTLPAKFTGSNLALRFHFYYNPSTTVSIAPSDEVAVRAGSSQEFVAAVKGSGDQTVNWSVTGAGCSGAACGTISGGLYLAPGVPPKPPVVTVEASSVADPDGISASVTVHLIAAGLTVSPASVGVASGAEQQFAASLPGTANPAVRWRIAGPGCADEACGNISETGLYTAPGSPPDPPTVTVTATLVSNPSQSASATVTVLHAPPP